MWALQEFMRQWPDQLGQEDPLSRWLVPMSVTADGGCQLGSSVLLGFIDSTPPGYPGLPGSHLSWWPQVAELFPGTGLPRSEKQKLPVPLKAHALKPASRGLCCKLSLDGSCKVRTDSRKGREWSLGQSTSTENKDKAVIYQKVFIASNITVFSRPSNVPAYLFSLREAEVVTLWGQRPCLIHLCNNAKLLTTTPRF